MKLRDKIQTTVQHDLSDDFIINLFFDGIEEITQRVIALDPSKAETFIYKTSERYSLESTPSTEQQESALKVFGDIVSVLVSWNDKLQANPVQGYHHRLRMSADKIPLEDYGDALDPKSFKYRGKGNPGYVLKKERNLTQNNEGQNHSSYNCVYVVPDPRTYGGEIEIHQVMYNIHPEYRGAFSSGSFEDLFKIKTVDVRLTFRSKKLFYRNMAKVDKPRLVKGFGDRSGEFTDRFLRDSVFVTIHTRNIGENL